MGSITEDVANFHWLKKKRIYKFECRLRDIKQTLFIGNDVTKRGGLDLYERCKTLWHKNTCDTKVILESTERKLKGND